jgi:MFS family permease
MPVFLASIVLMTGIASAAGPPLGGIFAESSMTWRLGFFLSIGECTPKGYTNYQFPSHTDEVSAAMAVIAGCLITFTFPEPVRVTSNYSFRERLKSTDQLSVVLILTSLTALFLALQWGGTKYQWSDPWIWGLLIGFAAMAGLFMFIQVKEKDRYAMTMFRQLKEHRR